LWARAIFLLIFS
jgi:hypothetical protein